MNLSSTTLFALRGNGHFERICGLNLSTPGLAPRKLILGAGNCPGRLGLEAPVALTKSHLMRSLTPIPDAPTLISAMLSKGHGATFDLTLAWLAGKTPATDFASYPILFGSSGKEIFRAVYAASAREHEILWPLFNDSLPPSRWRAGQMIVETYRLRRTRPWTETPARLRLAPFERRDLTEWKALPAQEVPIKTP